MTSPAPEGELPLAYCANVHPGASLAEVALAAGYYDQAHLGLEFRALAGLTPREFLASVYPDGTTAVA